MANQINIVLLYRNKNYENKFNYNEMNYKMPPISNIK